MGFALAPPSSRRDIWPERKNRSVGGPLVGEDDVQAGGFLTHLRSGWRWIDTYHGER